MFTGQEFLSNLTEYEITKNKLKDIQNKEGRDSFQKQLQFLREYLDSNESKKENRSIQCGLAYYNQCICVNIGILKNTLGKCKSTINNCLLQMGYTSIKSKSSANAILYEAMPSLKTSSNVKKWTVRTKSSQYKVNSFSIDSIKSSLMPSSKSAECLFIKTDHPSSYQQLAQSPIEHDNDYGNNNFIFDNMPNDFINDDFLNLKINNFNQSEFPSIFDEISSYY